jgi:iron-sulfur cluster repair protein YtfE (RIC family)
MSGSWESFLEEHARLRGRVERLRVVADMVGEVSPARLKAEVEKVCGFLSHRLLPHISVEERVLYPAIARAEGLGQVAQIMRLDHAEAAGLARELGVLRDKLTGETTGDEEANELRRVLYGLDAILRPHMGKEEQICLPALEKVLPPGRVRALMEGMELFDLAEQAGE